MKAYSRAFVSLAALAFGGCPSSHDDAGTDAMCATSGSQRIFVSTSNYETGQLAVIDPVRACVREGIAPISGDAVLGWHGTQLVVLNSGQGPAGPEDNVTVFDLTGDPPRLACQFAAHADGETGSGNPRGYLALDAQRGYLTRLAQPSVAIVDLGACAITGTIDLSAFRGPATLPFPRSITLVGREAWVAIERLPPDLTNPTTPGAIVRIDPQMNSAIQAIELHHPNPVGHFAQRPGRVWIASVGSYQRIDDGAVEEIDTATLAVTDEATEADLHGNVDAVIALDDDRLLLRVTDAATGSGLAINWTTLVEWRRSTRRPTARWLTVANYALTEPILASDGRVYVGDRGDVVAHRAATVRVFDALTGMELSPPIATILPPYDFAAGS